MHRTYSLCFHCRWYFSTGNTLYEILLAKATLREKSPNTEIFLVRIFPHSDLIRRGNPVSLHIESECGKIRIRKNSGFGHFSRSGLTDLKRLFIYKAKQKTDVEYGLTAFEFSQQLWGFFNHSIILGGGVTQHVVWDVKGKLNTRDTHWP